MLTLNQYREINALSDGGVFEKMIHAVSVIKGIDEYEVQEWDSSKLVSQYQEVEKQLLVSNTYSNKIEIEGLELQLMNFQMLTLGQWIDLETWVSDDYIGSLNKMAACFYLNHEGGGLYADKVEPYGKINVSYRAELIDELPAQQVVGACAQYLKFRKNLFDSYDIFNNPYEGVNIEELDEEEKAIYQEEQRKRERGAVNQWETMLNLLSNNDSSRFDDHLRQNVFLQLNQVTYLKSLKSNK